MKKSECFICGCGPKMHFESNDDGSGCASCRHCDHYCTETCYAKHEKEPEMDPEACLKLAVESLYSGEKDECRDALLNYSEWRQKGGFQPSITADEGNVTVSGDGLWFNLCFMWEFRFEEPIRMPSF